MVDYATTYLMSGFQKSGWGDSNARPLRPERSALPTALHPDFAGAIVKSAAKLRHFFEIRAGIGYFFIFYADDSISWIAGTRRIY